MPNRPKQVKRPWVPERKPFERDRTNEFDYNCRAWRNKRKAFLEANPLCCMCSNEGIVKQAAVVDHIIPIKQGGNPWADDNLQGLCKSHHDSKSGRERHAGGMGSNL